MTRRGAGGRAADRAPGAAELGELARWLLRVKGRRSFAELSAAAGAAGRPVTADTLRRALDGRVPTVNVVRAWAAGAHVAPAEGEDLLTLVRAARAPLAQQGYDASQITTWTGLVRAMKRVRARAGEPALRKLEESPKAAFRLPRSTLGAVLRGKAPVTAELLEAFLTACDVPDAEKRALLAARDRVENPSLGVVEWCPCAAVERAHDQLQYERGRSRYRGGPDPDEDEEGGDGDWYEAMLRRERVDPALVTDDELEALQAESTVDAVELPRAAGAAAAHVSRARVAARPLAAPSQVIPVQRTHVWVIRAPFSEQ
ncbi:hypothetical protein [Streptomyces sp. 6N106]|uniref:hypothetical protein n=1 Tax=Streptomyces sp. 6N106 TaxID=3457418 RepID=UPI003FCFEB6D